MDCAYEANYKFPWSYVCRAIGGVDTALWDLYEKIKQKPVVELLGGKAAPITAYASSMRRDIMPEDEAKRLSRSKDRYGYKAFKVHITTEFDLKRLRLARKNSRKFQQRRPDLYEEITKSHPIWEDYKDMTK